jgi:hypothetical protein
MPMKSRNERSFTSSSASKSSINNRRANQGHDQNEQSTNKPRWQRNGFISKRRSAKSEYVFENPTSEIIDTEQSNQPYGFDIEAQSESFSHYDQFSQFQAIYYQTSSSQIDENPYESSNFYSYMGQINVYNEFNVSFYLN